MVGLRPRGTLGAGGAALSSVDIIIFPGVFNLSNIFLCN